jgi:hypothetical protein
MPQKPVDVPPPPAPKSFKLEFRVTVFLKSNHLSTEAIEQAVIEAIRSRDGFAYVSDIGITEV